MCVELSLIQLACVFGVCLAIGHMFSFDWAHRVSRNPHVKCRTFLCNDGFLHVGIGGHVCRMSALPHTFHMCVHGHHAPF
jgi:hypothetical protein